MTKFRNLVRAAAMVAVAAGLTGAGDAEAQAQQTVQSAHQFLIQILPDGVTTFDGLTTDGDYSAEAKIVNVTSFGCQTTLYGIAQDNQKRISRRIDWSKVSHVYYYRGVQIAGAITTTNGSAVSKMVITPAGPNTGVRIETAMNFLLRSCDSAAKTGF